MILGFFKFHCTGSTPEKSYSAMLSLFTKTNGKSNDLLNFLTTFRKKSIISLQEDEKQSLQRLKGDGAIRFPDYINSEICKRLESKLSHLQGNSKPKGPAQEGKNFSECEKFVDSFSLKPTDLINDPDVQSIFTDPMILNLVEAYFEKAPILSAICAWWSTSNKISPNAESENAQMYHFDMERIKWLKYFIYVNDVTLINGPHCFVKGTHLSGQQPFEIRKKGYTRIPDHEIQKLFPQEKIEVFTGKRGTGILEDTRGYHKGMPPSQGKRLILQMEYCSSLFGVNSNTSGILKNYSPCLKECLRKNKKFDANFR